jgi:hypothetical protein
LLQDDGASVLYFNNCAFGDKSIEQLAGQLGVYIAGLHYTDGTPVSQVDLVAHSMGGLIVRAYLAGKSQTSGIFSPPANPMVRKLVTLGTPHFGSFQAEYIGVQESEMALGSQFLWDLATWNQGQDDLRGVDALAVIGNAGTYGNTSNASDGVVSLTSGSLGFIEPDQRTRIVPYCHIPPNLFTEFGIGMSCSFPEGIAYIDSSSHLSAQIVRSFLANTTAWQSIGGQPSGDPYLSRYGGGLLALKGSNDVYFTDLASAQYGNGGTMIQGPSASIASLFYTEFAAGGSYSFSMTHTNNQVTTGTASFVNGSARPLLFKFGPVITGAQSAGSTGLGGLTVASGSTIYIYGGGFSGTGLTVTANAAALAVSASSDQQISAYLPSGYNGLVKLEVSNANGQHTVNIMTAPASTPPTIALSTTSAKFAFTLGGSAPASQSVAISNSGGGTLSWTASSNSTWLTVSSASATGPGTLTIGINTAGLSAQTYDGAITITASGATNSPQTISVTLTVSGASGLAASINATAGGGQSAMINAPFSTALQATVRDSLGNPVPNAVVTFAAPSAGASGTFPGPSFIAAVTTNSSGVASAPALTANGTPGQYNVTATVAGVNQSASFPLTNTSAAPPPSGGSSVLPQFAFGGGWYSALYFTNPTSAAVSFPVSFVSDAGTPLIVPSLGVSTTQVNLAPYGTAIIEAPDVGSLVQGYAEFTLPSGAYGYGVFRQSVAGRPDQEAVVPFSDAGATSNTLTWDETNFVTAVAIVNPSSTAATVAVTLWGEGGDIIGTSSIPLPPSSKTETTLRTLPGLSGMVGQRGSAEFAVSAGNVAVLGLRFDGSAFTSIPTTSVTASNSEPSILPQLAFGGGWYSALYFTNATGAAASFPVNFVSDAGTPLTVPSVGGSTMQVNLAAYGTAIIEAPDAGSLLEGYAVFTLPSGVYGYGVFRQSVAGRPDQEAVVPFSGAAATSSTLTWDETNFITAVAIVNPNSTAATVTVTLWDENGNTIGTSSIPLPPSSKTETTLRTLQGLSGMVGQRGFAQFAASAGNVAVLGLRFNGSAFTSIPTMTATQIIP